MKKSFLKLYLINVFHIFIICFVYEIFFTFVLNATYGIGVWISLILFLFYKVCKILKSNLEKFILYFLVLFIPFALLNNYFDVFNLIEPRYFGADYFILYDYLPIKSKSDISEFYFWQTGVSSGFIYENNDSNFLVTFFTVPPVALFECLIKSIFPKLYVVLLLQLPYIIIKKKTINWRGELKDH